MLAIVLLLLLQVHVLVGCAGASKNHDPQELIRGGGGGGDGDGSSMLSTPSSLTSNHRITRQTKQILNHHFETPILSPISLQSHYTNDEAKVITMQSSSTSSSPASFSFTENLVPWKERNSFSHVAASCLTLSLLGLFIYHQFFFQVDYPSSSSSSSLFVGYLILIIAYIGEAAFCSTRRYLSNVSSPTQVIDLIQHLVQMRPIVQWKLECYHYNKNHHYSKGRNNDSKTDKIVTWRASRFFQYNEWKDLTDMEGLRRSIEYDVVKSDRPFKTMSLLKITLVKLLLFGNDTNLASYQMQQNRFIMEEGHRDTYTSTKTVLEVDGFKPKLLGVRTVVGGPGTGWLRLSYFWLFSLLGLTVPYRIWFERHCDRIEVVLAKEVLST